MLSRQEVSRYSRNILLPEIGRSGQERLKSSRVVVLGAGGLGSPLLLYLVAAGAGWIRVVDGDRLDLTNLQRQILYRTSDVGKAKVALAGQALGDLNPDVHLEAVEEVFHAGNALDLISGCNLVLEGFDNFPGKFLANDAAVVSGIPLLSGGILRFRGQILGIRPGVTACLRCVFYDQPPAHAVPSCAEAGVIGALAGVIGSLMAAEAIKILCGMDDSILGKLIQFELKETQMRTIQIHRRQSCAVCGRSPSIRGLEAHRYTTEESCLLP